MPPSKVVIEVYGLRRSPVYHHARLAAEVGVLKAQTLMHRERWEEIRKERMCACARV
jgi:hypothetical protein